MPSFLGTEVLLQGEIASLLWLSMPSTFQALSCLTLFPPHPSWEKSASRTEFSCSKGLEEEVEEDDDPPLLDELDDPFGAGFSTAGRPLPAAAAQEVLV